MWLGVGDRGCGWVDPWVVLPCGFPGITKFPSKVSRGIDPGVPVKWTTGNRCGDFSFFSGDTRPEFEVSGVWEKR